jgi:hypothetical protein
LIDTCEWREIVCLMVLEARTERWNEGVVRPGQMPRLRGMYSGNVIEVGIDGVGINVVEVNRLEVNRLEVNGV